MVVTIEDWAANHLGCNLFRSRAACRRRRFFFSHTSAHRQGSWL